MTKYKNEEWISWNLREWINFMHSACAVGCYFIPLRSFFISFLLFYAQNILPFKIQSKPEEILKIMPTQITSFALLGTRSKCGINISCLTFNMWTHAEFTLHWGKKSTYCNCGEQMRIAWHSPVTQTPQMILIINQADYEWMYEWMTELGVETVKLWQNCVKIACNMKTKNSFNGEKMPQSACASNAFTNIIERDIECVKNWMVSLVHCHSVYIKAIKLVD